MGCSCWQLECQNILYQYSMICGGQHFLCVSNAKKHLRWTYGCSVCWTRSLNFFIISSAGLGSFQIYMYVRHSRTKVLVRKLYYQVLIIYIYIYMYTLIDSSAKIKLQQTSKGICGLWLVLEIPSESKRAEHCMACSSVTAHRSIPNSIRRMG